LHTEADSAPAVEFAFRTALRLGVGVTALHAIPLETQNRIAVELRDPVDFFMRNRLHDALRIAQDVYPEVSLRIKTIVGPPAAELVAEEGQLIVASFSTKFSSASTSQLSPSLVLRASAIPVVLVKAEPT
jgi:hypothetical protein